MVCVIQHLLCSTPQADNTQRKKIFEGKCMVNGKVCKLVIDTCSCENLISQNLVNHFKLERHDSYTIGWIKKGVNTRVTKQCNLPLFLGKYYRSNVLCDVVDMDASMFFLGDLGSLMSILHTNGRKILTLSLRTRERSSSYQTNQMVIPLRRREKIC